MSEKKAKGCLIAALVWCVIAALLGVAFKFLVQPYLERKQREGKLMVAADSFSGYCLLRSEALREALKARQIDLEVVDDKADYHARLEALRSGRTQLAVFTIDSFLTAGAKAGNFPGSIVLVIDETKGGDAIVAYREAVSSLQDLNHPSARLVLTPASPSEFLARVVLAHFSLPQIGEDWLLPEDGAAAVFKHFRGAGKLEKKAFVLWEPYVSRALQQPGAQVLVDSGKLRGYIVDVLVARQDFLREKPEVARAFIECYARVAYRYARQPDELVKLVQTDARNTGGESLDEAQARKIVQGIQWKNTVENYAHFGLLPAAERGDLPTLEGMIGNITEVLLKTRALSADPLDHQRAQILDDRILGELRAARFHPGKDLNLIGGVGAGEDEVVRRDKELAALTPEDWTKLRPVGELRLPPLEFSRGSASLGVAGERDLQSLAERLRSFPHYYLRIVGHARPEGDPEANRVLAKSRADAAAQFLIGQGVLPQRLRAETAATEATGGAAQSVSFVVGQMPY